MGYRYYNAHQIPFTTGFPFGHGLSYTTFSYHDLHIACAGPWTCNVEVSVTNTGKVVGAEVHTQSHNAICCVLL